MDFASCPLRAAHSSDWAKATTGPSLLQGTLRVGRLPEDTAPRKLEIGERPPPALWVSARAAVTWAKGVLSALAVPTVGAAATRLADQAASRAVGPWALAILLLVVVSLVVFLMEMMTAHRADASTVRRTLDAASPTATVQRALASGPLVAPHDCECMLTLPADAASVFVEGGARRVSVLDARGFLVVSLGVSFGRSPAGAPRTAPRLTLTAGPGSDDVLAHCSASPAGKGPYYVYRPSGEVFATVGPAEDVLRMHQRLDAAVAQGTHRFVLMESTGGKLTFDAPGKHGYIRVSDGGGNLCAAVGTQSSGSAEEAPGGGDVCGRIVLRIQPGVDVAAVLCGLFCMLQLLRLEEPTPQDIISRLVPLDQSTDVF